MATKEVKQRITLEGEKQYNEAIRAAQRNLRTLRSELKAETAELGKNATEQQKAEARAKSLKQQIAEQEKVVNTLKEALKEAKEQYGDNADVVQSWEQKLNNARATLATMKNDLSGLGDGFHNAQQEAAASTVATKSFADSLGSIAEAGEAVSSGIEKIFQGMIGTVRDAITEVWADMVDLAGRANAWVDLAGFWNTDAATIQKWTHAVEGAHNSFEDLNNAVTRINMGDQKKIATATGVSSEIYQDRWEYAMAVMDAMGKMNYEQRLAAAGEVFGEKRATKIMDLLNDWGTIRENLAKFDAENGGIGMNNEQIQNMSTLAEKVSLIKETWRAFLDEFEAEHFAKLALDLTGQAQVILEDLIKYLDSGNDEDLQKLEKDIADFFDRIKQALENAAGKLDEAGKKLQESDNGIVRLIGKAMSDLAGALEWLSKDENIDKVIHGFEVLAAFWLAGKGASLVATIVEFGANLKVIKSFNAFSAAAGAVSGTGAVMGSMSSVITQAVASAAGPIATAIAGVTMTVGVAAMAVPVISVLKSLIVDGKWPDWMADPTKSTGEVVLPNADKETQEAVTEFLENPKAPANKKDALHWMFGKLTGTDTETTETAPEKRPPDGYLDTAPAPSRPKVGIDATAAQQAAAEAFWDILRSGDWGENDQKLDSAWDAMEQAFAGNEKEFERLDGWLDRLQEEWNANKMQTDYNEGNWQDIPSTWWLNPAGGDAGNNGVTAADLQGFREVPAAMQRAVAAGAAAGVSGIQVTMDGRTVGELVAPYVSEAIARDIA